MTSSFFHCHAHSEFSCLDGMPPVRAMVERADAHGHVALALTDHGNMSGALRLYKECRSRDLVPFPGVEAYLVSHFEDKEAPRYHIGILSLDLKGYQGLAKLSSLSHRRDHYHYKPRFDLNELWEFGTAYGEHVAVLTGCFYGLIVQTLVSGGNPLPILKKMAKHFPYLFVELQHHNINHDGEWDEDTIICALTTLAIEAGLPVIATQDSHYVDLADRDCHDMMKRLVMHSGGADDVIFPGDGYHLSDTAWVKSRYPKGLWEDIEDSYEVLLEGNRLTMPALDTYKFCVPEFSMYPDSALKREVVSGMMRYGFDIWDHYDNRAKYELGVISKMGMGNYFLLIADLVKWCKKQGIMVEARGSANGSLVCYVLGITQVDPIEWNLSFDRFLHPSRKKPPDIDLDIDRDRRDEVVAYMGSKFESYPIGTYGTLRLDEYGRGSAAVKYLSYVKKITDPEQYAQTYAKCKTLWDIEEVNPEAAKVLRTLSEMEVRTAPGTHAAGYVLSTQERRIEDYLPTMLIPSSNTTVTQPTMDDVEDAGYTKVDLLGSTSLAIRRRCLELIGRNPADGVEWIPNDDKATCKTLRSGVARNGIFQFEGVSTAKGGRQMGIKKTNDVILCMALYRTALMKSGHTETYLNRRKKVDPVTYVHPLFESVLKETYGVVVFQDQVISILRAIGMRYEELNDLLKAIKQSNDKVREATLVFDRIKPIFVKLCRKSGFTNHESEAAWEQIMDFNEYGFNRAHATGYGLRAYRQAYLKTHHPTEFMAAVLEINAGTPKEMQYVQEARRMGIKLMSADVNISGVFWTIDKQKGGIRRGLLSVKGVGPACANEIISKQPFSSFEDFVERVSGSLVTGAKPLRLWVQGKGEETWTGQMKNLRDSGAFRSYGISSP